MGKSTLSELFADEADGKDSQESVKNKRRAHVNQGSEKRRDRIDSKGFQATRKNKMVNLVTDKHPENGIVKGSGSGCSVFRMPLHYPTYTEEEYKAMPEWELDRLLAEYGLSTQGDLAYKRDMAMGAFLWPASKNKR